MQNQLIAALPGDEHDRLAPHLELVPLTLGQTLHDPEHVYFPVDCVIALLYELKDGADAEISLVGNEGVTGVAVPFGPLAARNIAVVQGAGQAQRLRASTLQREFSRDDELQRLLFNYTRALLAQMAQTATCNWSHPLHQRLCRWLLLTLDRLPSTRLILDQALVARILGAPQDEVDAAAAKLQRLGAIRYDAKQITVLNRPQLERLCCTCYALVRGEADRLMPAANYKLRSMI